jgi:ribosomal-protein-alanine N-acetyltransferase
MTLGDVASVAAIERSAFSTPWSEATFERLLERPDAEVTVLEVPPHGVVGYSVLWCVLDQAELANIAVAEAWRGRRWGALLLDHTMERARERGVHKLFLEVRESNERAVTMYTSRGFESIGRRRNYYERPREDARVLLKRLHSPGDPQERP